MIRKALRNDTLIVSSARFLSKLSGFVFFMILARLLSVNDYGVLAIIISVYGVLLPLFSGKFYLTATYLVSKSKKKSKTFSDLIPIQIIISVISFLFLFFASDVIARFYELNISIPLKILSVSLSVELLTMFYWSYFLGKKEFKKYSLVLFFDGFSYISLPIIFYFLLGWVGIFIGLSASKIFSLLFYSFVINQRISLRINFSLWKEVWDYGKYLFLSSVISIAYAQVDVLILAKFIDKATLGLYYIASKIAIILVIIGTSASMVNLSKTSGVELKEIKNVIKKNFKEFLVLNALCIPLILLSAPLIIPLLFGQEYVRSVNFLIPLTIVYFLAGLSGILTSGIQGVGRFKEYLLIQLLGTIPALFLFFVLIPAWGIAGAIISMVFMYGVMAALSGFRLFILIH